MYELKAELSIVQPKFYAFLFFFKLCLRWKHTRFYVYVYLYKYN